jgi:spore germination protein KB
MRKEVISNKQGVSLISLFIWGSTLVIGTAGPAKKDAWIAVLLAATATCPLMLMYSKILSSFQGRNIFEINDLVFGNIFGKIINTLYTWFAFHLGALVINNFMQFISTVGLPDTPRVVPIMFFTILCIWGAKEGIEVLGRWAELFILFLITILCFTIPLSLTEGSLDNIRPILYGGIKPVIMGTILAFSFPFAETVVVTMVSCGFKNKKSPQKIFIYSLILTTFFLVLITIRNVLTTGERALMINYFPAYMIISRINIGEFIQRIETAVAVSFLIAGFIKVSLCLLAACKGVTDILGFNEYRFLVTPIGLSMLSTSFIELNR